eukprot:8645567-Pyramimonas_sp.AAC.1
MGQTPKGSPILSWAVGPGGAPERLPGGAGHRLRELAERHHLFAINTSAWRPTFFAETHASQIDYLQIPQEWRERTATMGPLCRMGRRLQVMRSRALRDRVPTHVTIATM